MKKLLVIAIAILGFSAISNAQSSATATASSTATIISPIQLAKTTDLNFGTVIPSATTGTVALDYADVRTAGGGVTLLTSSTAQKTAVFAVTGQINQAFNISVPAAAIPMSGAGLSTGMTVSGFAADLGTSSTLDGTGHATIKVKATLNVPANALPGVYSNASDLSVTVNYN